jgi:hypothetical protein
VSALPLVFCIRELLSVTILTSVVMSEQRSSLENLQGRFIISFILGHDLSDTQFIQVSVREAGMKKRLI